MNSELVLKSSPDGIRTLATALRGQQHARTSMQVRGIRLTLETSPVHTRHTEARFRAQPMQSSR